MDWIYPLRELNMLTIILRMTLAILFGIVIGSERSRQNNPAGLRTHVLVCLGSALVMMTSQFLTKQFATLDLSRMGAQVISGIGFLGAGTIILSGGKVKGLTTAAGLWATACLGLALGIGFYEGAVLGFLAMTATLALLRNFSHKLVTKSQHIALYIIIDGLESLSRMSARFNELGVTIESLDFLAKDLLAGAMALEIDLVIPRRMTKTQLLSSISALGDIKVIETM